jgi:hypothetical protein
MGGKVALKAGLSNGTPFAEKEIKEVMATVLVRM